MPNDLIQALMGRTPTLQAGPSPFGMEPPRPEDAIRDLYKSSAPQSSWMHDFALKTMPGPQSGSIAQDIAGSIPFASLGLSPSVKFHYTSTGQPMTQSQGRIVGQGRPIPPHPATDLAPFIGAGQVAANAAPSWALPAESQMGAERPVQMPGGPKGDRLPIQAEPSFDSRFGGMTPPAAAPEAPAWLQGAGMSAPASASLNVPLPRAKPQQTAARKVKQKPKAAPQEEPNAIVKLLRSLGLG